MSNRSLVLGGWTRRSLIALALPAAFWVGALAGQSPAGTAKPNPSDLNRVKPGVEAPPFTLPDAQGKPHKLTDFRGAPAVLVFYRGYW